MIRLLACWLHPGLRRFLDLLVLVGVDLFRLGLFFWELFGTCVYHDLASFLRGLPQCFLIAAGWNDRALGKWLHQKRRVLVETTGSAV